MKNNEVAGTEKAPDHLAVFLPTMAGGGAERVMLNLINGFIERGEKVDLVLASATGPYMNQLSDRINLVDLGVSRTLFSIIPLARYLKKSRPKVVVSALNHANIAAILANMLSGHSSTVAITLHCSLPEQKESTQLSLNSRFYRFMSRWLYPRADRVIAVSSGVARYFADYARLPLASIKVIYNPVINQSLLESSREQVDHPWFAANEPPVVLSVGRLSDQKNYAALVKAIAVVRQKRPVRLMILGEGELRGSLESLVRSLELTEHVALPGFVDNPYKFMARADLFVLSSKWEGLPTVLIEALAIGTPVVSTDCRSGPDEILEGGRLGKLVPVDDVDALAAAIVKSLAGERSVADCGRLVQYEFETAVKEYLHVVRG